MFRVKSVMYSNSSAICQQWLAKRNQTRKTLYTEEQIPCAQPWSLITLLDSTLLNLYPCPTSASTPTIPYSTCTLLSSTLYSSLLCLYSTPTLLIASLLYAILYSALLFPTSTILYSTRLYLYSDSILLTSTLLHAGAHRTQWSLG